MDQNIDITVNEYAFEQLADSKKFGHDYKVAAYTGLAKLIEIDSFGGSFDGSDTAKDFSNLASGEAIISVLNKKIISKDYNGIKDTIELIGDYVIGLEKDLVKQYFSTESELEQVRIKGSIDNILKESAKIKQIVQEIEDLKTDRGRYIKHFEFDMFNTAFKFNNHEEDDWLNYKKKCSNYFYESMDNMMQTVIESVVPDILMSCENMMKHNQKYVASKLIRRKNIGAASSMKRFETIFRNLTIKAYKGQ